MRHVAVVGPQPLARTGGSIYNRRIADGLRRLGWAVDMLALDDSFPFPTAEALENAARTLDALPRGTVAIVDSLALGAMPSIIATAGSRLPIVALMHLPLSADVGIDRDIAARFEDAERHALAAAALVIATGEGAIPLLARYGLPRDSVRIVEPGTDAAPIARGSAGGRLELVCVATLNPIKGHVLLLEALSRVAVERWHLTCAGSLTRAPETVTRVRETIARLGMESRVTLAGELDETALAALYDRSDVAVLASRQETYGMAVAEALARGLPVVATATGAAPALVGSDAGLLVPSDEADSLSEALSRVISDDGQRARLAEGARRARLRLRTWDDAARQFEGLLDGVTVLE